MGSPHGEGSFFEAFAPGFDGCDGADEPVLDGFVEECFPDAPGIVSEPDPPEWGEEEGAGGFEEWGDELPEDNWGMDLELPDFDEAPAPVRMGVVDVDERVSRSARAFQVAVEVAEPHGWDLDGVTLLAGVFDEHGWSAAKTSMVRELNAGMTPGELRLARILRHLWAEHPEFSSVSRGYGPWDEAIAPQGWKLSWPAALEIVRSFGSVPDAEEVEVRLRDLYERWYGCTRLRRRFPAFRGYITYRLGAPEGTIRGWEGWVFDEAPDPFDERLDWHRRHTLKDLLG